MEYPKVQSIYCSAMLAFTETIRKKAFCPSLRDVIYVHIVIGHLGAVTLKTRQRCHAQWLVGIMRQSKKQSSILSSFSNWSD